MFGQVRAAEGMARQAIRGRPDEPFLHTVLAMTLAAQDRLEEARAEVAEAIRLRPDFSLANLGRIANMVEPATRSAWLDLAAKAGLPP